METCNHGDDRRDDHEREKIIQRTTTKIAVHTSNVIVVVCKIVPNVSMFILFHCKTIRFTMIISGEEINYFTRCPFCHLYRKTKHRQR